jgi:hypothetical protein
MPAQTSGAGARKLTAPPARIGDPTPTTPEHPTAGTPPERPASTATSAAAVSQPRESAEDRATLDRLEVEIDQLEARAVAVNGTLDRMQQEQARTGVGLRGDMAARQQSMNTNMKRAQDALTARDAARAQRFRDLTERDLEALEKFLGR